MKRLLALDGGGIRGVFSLEILAQLETKVRQLRGRPDLVLAEYFDYIAGTSTGAIIATCLSWGMSVAQVQDLYTSRAIEIFQPAPLYRRFWNKFGAAAITELFKSIFSEDGEGKVPALLGTKKLRTLLTLVMRNHTTGSPWPVSNNPAAKYNDLNRPNCNLNLPLWQLVRASTAAPVYFPPETIELGGTRHVFVDGGITPYNNPSLLLFSMATLPCYNLAWPTGVDNLMLVSIGTGRVPTGAGTLRAEQMNLFFHARSLPLVLMDSISLQQDILCRTIGHCVEGDWIDSEVGDLHGNPEEIGSKQFRYIRYDHAFTEEDRKVAQRTSKSGITLDNLRLIPFLREVGGRYAAEHVKAEHLD